MDEPPTIAVSSSDILMKGGTEGVRGEDNSRRNEQADILKEKPHHVNAENVSVSVSCTVYVVKTCIQSTSQEYIKYKSHCVVLVHMYMSIHVQGLDISPHACIHTNA